MIQRVHSHSREASGCAGQVVEMRLDYDNPCLLTFCFDHVKPVFQGLTHWIQSFCQLQNKLNLYVYIWLVITYLGT